MSQYQVIRLGFYKWRHTASLSQKIVLSLALAGLTGVGAQLKIYLPFTPVPVTGQVFFIQP